MVLPVTGPSSGPKRCVVLGVDPWLEEARLRSISRIWGGVRKRLSGPPLPAGGDELEPSLLGEGRRARRRPAARYEKEHHRLCDPARAASCGGNAATPRRRSPRSLAHRNQSSIAAKFATLVLLPTPVPSTFTLCVDDGTSHRISGPSATRRRLTRTTCPRSRWITAGYPVPSGAIHPFSQSPSNALSAGNSLPAANARATPPRRISA